MQNTQQNFKISDFQNFVAKSTRPWFKSDTYYARNRARILREAKNRRDKGQWLSQPSQEHWRRLYSAAKDRAKKKQIPFSLTREWVETRLAAGKCEVTGAAFLSTTGKPGMYSASIDRIEPSKGYTPENSRMVIWAFNRMKSDMTDEETMTLARLVTARDNC